MPSIEVSNEEPGGASRWLELIDHAGQDTQWEIYRVAEFTWVAMAPLKSLQ